MSFLVVTTFIILNVYAYTVRVGDLIQVGEGLGLQKTLINIRRKIHREPEIGLNLPETAKTVAAYLEHLHVDEERISTGWALNKSEQRGYGIVADFGTGKEPCVLVRGDMDALPIYEMTDVPWKSVNSGAMHACGHDAHTAMMCGVAAFLRFHESHMKGTVRLVFQPGEEGYRGMQLMINEGLLDNKPPPSRALALHVHPGFPTGAIVTGGGNVIAAGAHFRASVRGRGGHAGIPAGAVDPVVGAASIIQAWQSLVSRETLGKSARGVGLVSVTSVHTDGQAANVIPDEVHLAGTVRAMTMEIFEYMKRRFVEVGNAIAAAHRCNFTAEFAPHMPNLHNDYNLLQELAPVLEDFETKQLKLDPGEFSYVLEDFAFLSQRIPSAMFFLGIHNSQMTPHTSFSLHHPQFNLDENALLKGSAFLTAAALHLLDLLSDAKPRTEL
eukprot:Gregarina_sp_Poly_1__10437@NODE_754_length_6432_cov_237_128358_g558_i0_p3_GENE_NODE_754_length_6432_cov_237_128358_g558_i0NODE_754_length_6432_cov_237_128358_g558_i0_p3_ORF_typecomplete_len441_score51_09Peptidase_M20/PF01546_28/1_7e42M20_dimer/PF07687_14/2_6e03M20_dimer/PF07687_14/3e12_NODE_754_length_6432_cov_237_128358_g558_i050586380